MPRAAAVAATPPAPDTADLLDELMEAAVKFAPLDRAEAMVRKWVGRAESESVPEQRMAAMLADAAILGADLLLSQPSASGSTPFDRLAKNRARAPAAEAAALTALCRARFRLLTLEGDATTGEVPFRDAITGETFAVTGTEFPPLAPGTRLFARVAIFADGRSFLAGEITPLDQAAFMYARSHATAGAMTVTANARWAEAVFGHVVRHGTLEVPGLNRPAADDDTDDEEDDDAFGGFEDDPLYQLAMAWAALDGGPADAGLLHRTRQFTELDAIIGGLAAATLTRDAKNRELGAGAERMLLVQLETVMRRERSGSSRLTLDAIARAIDDAIGIGLLPSACADLLASLRQRLAGASTTRRADDPALERLVARIQALRAKTVEQGCTEQEALAAAEKVAELLDRYGLSLGELDLQAQPCEGIGIQTDRRRIAPIDGCVVPIAAFFDCRVWLEHGKGEPLRYVFFGLRGDVTAAQYLYELVERAFETETAAFRAGELYASMGSERRSATNSFQVGLARGITDKLTALREQRDAAMRSASGRDLVPVKAAMVEEELAKLGLDLQSRSAGGRRRVLTDAFLEGKAAGERFELTPGITRAA